jgi:NAD(P)-dependent dehydrogenase (short-subunit alcohol dehydrogenase family)
MSAATPGAEVAIVTGGLRGLGRAMALGLLRSGRKVVAVGHIAEDMPALQRDAGEYAGALHCLALDLRKPAACDEVVASAQRRFGGLDILVNNAGLTFTYTDPERFVKGPRKFWELTDEIVQNTMDTNYIVADQLARRAAPILTARGWGRIINVTTKLDTMNRAGSVPYGPSKAALEMATEIWAKELSGTGVTVNIVNPGAGANTPGMAKEMREWSATGKAEARRAGRNGGAAALRRLARGRQGARLSFRRQYLADRHRAGRQRPTHRPQGGLRPLPALRLLRSLNHHARSDDPCNGIPSRLTRPT